MPKQSTIKRLPPEVRERIGVLLEQGRTLDEILDALAGLDVQVSRSALHRYKQHIDKVGERIRRSRDMAEALVQRFGDEPESKVARMNIQFLHAAITDVISSAEATDEEGNIVPLDPRSAMELAKALDHLGKASKADADLISRIREEATKAANKQAASTVSEVGRKAGVSGTVIDQMMQAVLGGAV
jgi:ABC-type transporter Mla subunit MlaD